MLIKPQVTQSRNELAVDWLSSMMDADEEALLGPYKRLH